MGAFTSYMFVAGLVLLFFYLTYRWLLADEKQPAFNRAVLLGSYVLAAIVPALAAAYEARAAADGRLALVMAGGLEPTGIVADLPAESWTAILPQVAVGLYLVGVAAMLLYTATMWLRIADVLRRGDHRPLGRYTLVLLDDGAGGMARVAPFSWMRYIVMSRADYEQAAPMIIAHEMKHLDCRHPLDLLLGQAAIVLLWYNPASWLMLDELRTVHEYQADMAVLADGHDARDYQMLLIKKAVGQSFPVLANSLNHSKLKKRITMMLKSPTSKGRRVRALAMVPALALALAVINLPFVSCGLSSVSDVDKDTEKSPSDEVIVVKDLGAAGLEKDDIAEISIDNDGNMLIATKDRKKYRINADDAVRVVGHPGDQPSVLIDGRQATMEEAKALDTEDIESITVHKSPDVIDVKTVGAVAKEVDALPEFKGGQGAMFKFLAENVRYPEDAVNAGKEGRVVVHFVVKADGSIAGARVDKPVYPSLDAEAIRVISSMPAWTPGTKDGRPVGVEFSLPVQFKLQ